MFRSGKVLSNRAYRAKDWNPRAAEVLSKDLPLIQRHRRRAPNSSGRTAHRAVAREVAHRARPLAFLSLRPCRLARRET
jgi:hypothetical protein